MNEGKKTSSQDKILVLVPYLLQHGHSGSLEPRSSVESNSNYLFDHRHSTGISYLVVSASEHAESSQKGVSAQPQGQIQNLKNLFLPHPLRGHS